MFVTSTDTNLDDENCLDVSIFFSSLKAVLKTRDIREK